MNRQPGSETAPRAVTHRMGDLEFVLTSQGERTQSSHIQDGLDSANSRHRPTIGSSELSLSAACPVPADATK